VSVGGGEKEEEGAYWRAFKIRWARREKLGEELRALIPVVDWFHARSRN
jgi:hypothetical protein